MALLRFFGGPQSGQTIGLIAGQNQVGRGPQNNIKITDASVSGKHAQVWQESGQWFVMDHGSTNGTYKNDVECPPRQAIEVKHGDKINFGNISLVLDATANAAAQGPMPSVGHMVGPPMSIPKPPAPPPIPLIPRPPAVQPPPVVSDPNATANAVPIIRPPMPVQQIPPPPVPVHAAPPPVMAPPGSLPPPPVPLTGGRPPPPPPNATGMDVSAAAVFQREMQGLRAALESKEEALGRLSRELEQTKNRLEDAEAEASMAPEGGDAASSDRVKALEAELSEKTALLEKLQINLRVKESEVASLKRLEDAGIRANRAEDEAAALAERLAAAEKERETLTQQWEQSSRDLTDADDRLEKAGREVERLTARLAEAEKAAGNASDAIAQAARDRQAALEQRLDGVESELSGVRDEKGMIEQRLASAKDDLAAAAGDADALRAELAKAAEARAAAEADAQATLAAVQGAVAAEKERAERAERQAAETQAELSRVLSSGGEQTATLAGQLEALRAEKAGLLAQVDEKQRAYEEVAKSSENLVGKIIELRQSNDDARAEVARLTAQIGAAGAGASQAAEAATAWQARADAMTAQLEEKTRELQALAAARAAEAEARAALEQRAAALSAELAGKQEEHRLLAAERADDAALIADLQGQSLAVSEASERMQAELHAVTAARAADAETIAHLRSQVGQSADTAAEFARKDAELQAMHAARAADAERHAALQGQSAGLSAELQRKDQELQSQASLRAAAAAELARKDEELRALAAARAADAEVIASLRAQAGDGAATAEALAQKEAELASLAAARAADAELIASLRAQSAGGDALAAALAEKDAALQSRAAAHAADGAAAAEALARKDEEIQAVAAARTADAAALADLRAKLDQIGAGAGEASQIAEGWKQRAEALRAAMAEKEEEIQGLVAGEAAKAETITQLRAELAASGSGVSEAVAAAQAWQHRAETLQAQIAASEEETSGMRREAHSLRQALNAAETAPLVAPSGGGSSYEPQALLSLVGVARAMLDLLNGEAGRLRRNADILGGYVQDAAGAAAIAKRLDPTAMSPEQGAIVRELLDEAQPDVIVSNMEGVLQECADAAGRLKGLALDFKDALADDEGGADVERAFSRAQSLLAELAPGAEPRLDVGGALPLLPIPSSHALLAALAVLHEARRTGAEGSPATLAIAPAGDAVAIRLGGTANGVPADPMAGDEHAALLDVFVKARGGSVESSSDQEWTITLK